MIHKHLRLLIVAVFALLAAGCSRPAPRLPQPPVRTEPWDPAVVEAIASLPVQNGGRVMPLGTFAAFTLYFVHGRRDVQYMVGSGTDTKKVTLEPTEWLLDTWCFPEQAANYPLFRIENVGVFDALGFANQGQSQQFEFLSYEQIMQAADKLQGLAAQYGKKPANTRNPVEAHLVQTFQQLVAYHNLFNQFKALQGRVAVKGEALQAALGGSEAGIGDVLRHAEAFRSLVKAAGNDLESEANGNLAEVLAFVNDAMRFDRGPAVLPPLEADAEAWLAIPEAVDHVMRGGAAPEHVAMVASLQDALQAPSFAEMGTRLRAFGDAVWKVARPRADAAKVDLEAYYYRASWHYQALHYFLFAFLLAVISWLVPRNRWIWWGTLGVTAVAFGFLVTDVWLRCVISERPPIKNLYDTFLFIGGVAVFIAMITELVLPKRIALAGGPLLGALLIMFGRMFEVADGQDTLKPLVAVLDSNFWLATHVTTINIGYGAGFVGALFGSIWLLLRALRIAHPASALAKAVIRMTYGTVCFALALAVVGTILGGVWANDSWGRFWGWDPKENGALLICLAQVALLHARFSGMVRDFGFAVWSTLSGMVVLFSWFHTNLLGVGLHNYGFSSGLHNAVWSGYAFLLGVVLLGTVDRLLRPDASLGIAPPMPERAAKGTALWPATE